MSAAAETAVAPQIPVRVGTPSSNTDAGGRGGDPEDAPATFWRTSRTDDRPL